MRFERLAGVAAIALLATVGSASAAPVITILAPNSFSLLDLGTGTANSRQNAITSPFAVNSGGITTITFSGGAASGDSSQASGVYAGNQGSIAASPLGSGDSTTNYLVAQPGTAGVDNVTVNYATAQTTLDILWGTVDLDQAATGDYNLVTAAGQADHRQRHSRGGGRWLRNAESLGPDHRSQSVHLVRRRRRCAEPERVRVFAGRVGDHAGGAHARARFADHHRRGAGRARPDAAAAQIGLMQAP